MRRTITWATALVLGSAGAGWAQTSMGTAFTYQGRLTDAGSPANGSYDMRFSLYDAVTGGNQVGPTRTALGVPVENGLFTVSPNFGGGYFQGDARWLEIEVAPAGSGSYTLLSPRQSVRPTPYALYAGEAGSVADGISGTGSANYVAKFTSAQTIGNSTIFDNGTNVGIGTATPAQRLSVNGLIESLTGGFKFPDGTIQTTAGAGTSLWQQSGSDIYYNSGDVGIGNTNPDTRLVVEWNANNNITPIATVRTTGTDSTAAIRFENAVGNEFNLGITGNNEFALGYNANIPQAGDLLRITSTGNVGIGTTNPIHKLEVGNASDNSNYLRLNATDYSGVLFYNNEGSNSGGVRYDHTGDSMTFSTRSSVGTALERMRITSEGNVGIGTASPLHRLHLVTDQEYGGYFDSAATTGWAYGVVGRAEGPAGGAGGTSHLGVSGSATGARTNIGVAGAGSGMTTEGSSYGVYGSAGSNFGPNYGVYGMTIASTPGDNYAIYGRAMNSGSSAGAAYAGYFDGDVEIIGNLSKSSGSFKIDHPLDPENKYLQHSFVESPDMMNVYNGNSVLDENGEAVITMPDWFEALNMDFRYQLTCIGGFAPVYIAEEISDNRFKIAGGKPGLKVSWQVTGIRKDPYAKANRIQVEVDKRETDKAKYLHPEAYGFGRDKRISTLSTPPRVPKP